jgi:hypothetical protein
MQTNIRYKSVTLSGFAVQNKSADAQVRERTQYQRHVHWDPIDIYALAKILADMFFLSLVTRRNSVSIIEERNTFG